MSFPDIHPDNGYTTCAIIDLDALERNIHALLKHLGPEVQLYAVVKANAYGHGAVPVAQTVVASGAHRLGIGRTDEGVRLRQAGLTVPILNLGYAVPAEAEIVVENDITSTINTVEGAQALSARAGALGKKATVHIKVDTGMGRYGLMPEEVIAFLGQVYELPNLIFEGIFTHFSVADEADKAYTLGQLKKFREVLAAVDAAGYRFPMRHAANSAAALDMPETHFDAVRVGLAMHGIYPSEHVSRQVKLDPTLSVRSIAARVRTLPPGSSIGYGRIYTTSAPTKVVLVPFGYGDGIAYRHLSNKGRVLIQGQVAPIIGRISMDLLTVDATGIEGVAQDDEVVILGAQGDRRITAEEIAADLGTINYEVVTGLSPRVPRLYLRDGKVVDVLTLTNGC